MQALTRELGHLAELARKQVVAAAEEAGRPAPKVAVWLSCAVDPQPETMILMNWGFNRQEGLCCPPV